MMYPYMTLNDNTEIVNSEMLDDGRVKVCIEKPVSGGFHHATCYLPKYEREDIYGFSEKEVDFFKTLVQNNAHIMIEFSREGGFSDASNF